MQNGATLRLCIHQEIGKGTKNDDGSNDKPLEFVSTHRPPVVTKRHALLTSLWAPKIAVKLLDLFEVGEDVVFEHGANSRVLPRYSITDIGPDMDLVGGRARSDGGHPRGVQGKRQV